MRIFPKNTKGGTTMAESILDGKKLLVVDDEPDVLEVIEEEIHEHCPNCELDKATTYEAADDLLKSKMYDLVILDIMGVRGFDLLEIAVSRKFKTAMLTAHALSAEALKKSHDMGASSYLPKQKLGQLVPFLEDVLKHDHQTGWKRVLEKLGDLFDVHFESDWRIKHNTSTWY
jgi:DNA-binding response OmpR family regulator